MIRALAGLAMIGGALYLCRHDVFGAVPRSLFNNIDQTTKRAEKFALEDDCNRAFESLATGFRQLLRANARAEKDSELVRIEKQIARMDEVAKLLDAVCESEMS